MTAKSAAARTGTGGGGAIANSRGGGASGSSRSKKVMLLLRRVLAAVVISALILLIAAMASLQGRFFGSISTGTSTTFAVASKRFPFLPSFGSTDTTTTTEDDDQTDGEGQGGEWEVTNTGNGGRGVKVHFDVDGRTMPHHASVLSSVTVSEPWWSYSLLPPNPSADYADEHGGGGQSSRRSQNTTSESTVKPATNETGGRLLLYSLRRRQKKGRKGGGRGGGDKKKKRSMRNLILGYFDDDRQQHQQQQRRSVDEESKGPDDHRNEFGADGGDGGKQHHEQQKEAAARRRHSGLERFLRSFRGAFSSSSSSSSTHTTSMQHNRQNVNQNGGESEGRHGTTTDDVLPVDLILFSLRGSSQTTVEAVRRHKRHIILPSSSSLDVHHDQHQHQHQQHHGIGGRGDDSKEVVMMRNEMRRRRATLPGMGVVAYQSATDAATVGTSTAAGAGAGDEQQGAGEAAGRDRQQHRSGSPPLPHISSMRYILYSFLFTPQQRRLNPSSSSPSSSASSDGVMGGGMGCCIVGGGGGCSDLYGVVMLTDVSDVVFVTSPFPRVARLRREYHYSRFEDEDDDNVDEDGRGRNPNLKHHHHNHHHHGSRGRDFLAVVQETPSLPFAYGANVNSDWVNGCFGDEMERRLDGETVFCSGTTFGSVRALSEYTKAMTRHILLGSGGGGKDAGACRGLGVDQGIHNVLIYNGSHSRRNKLGGDGAEWADLVVPLLSTKAHQRDNGRFYQRRRSGLHSPTSKGGGAASIDDEGISLIPIPLSVGVILTMNGVTDLTLLEETGTPCVVPPRTTSRSTTSTHGSGRDHRSSSYGGGGGAAAVRPAGGFIKQQGVGDEDLPEFEDGRKHNDIKLDHRDFNNPQKQMDEVQRDGEAAGGGGCVEYSVIHQVNRCSRFVKHLSFFSLSEQQLQRSARSETTKGYSCATTIENPPDVWWESN